MIAAPLAPPLVDLTEVATRIARAIAEAQAAPAESNPRALVFRVGPLRLALPLLALKEVLVPPPRLSRVPRAPAAVLGIMNLRGRVVVVVDLLHALPPDVSARAREAGTPAPPGQAFEDGRILLLERGRREIGLFVRAVDGIEPVSTAPALLDPEQVAAALEAIVA
jgi:purine-binding chemotaxis protein CheW